jgi:prepilin-type N-terminal cleavage/methylation domain-containing protein/prepilin-type processing-associated H-X9-DG protein
MGLRSVSIPKGRAEIEIHSHFVIMPGVCPTSSLSDPIDRSSRALPSKLKKFLRQENHMYNSQIKRAFTLIELLVVIAIIAILAAILFPVFAQAKASAKKSVCISNQKQIGLGIIMYGSDVDDTYPMDQWYDNTTPASPQVRWQASVEPYIKNGTIFTFDNRASGAGGIFHDPAIYDQEAMYGVHNWLFPDGGDCPWVNTATTPTVVATQIDSPAQRVVEVEKGLNLGNSSWLQFIGDEWGWVDTVGNPQGSVNGHHYDIDQTLNRDCDFAPSGTFDNNQWNTYAECGSFPGYRHANTSAMSFADGHCKSMNRGQVIWFNNIYLPGIMPNAY